MTQRACLFGVLGAFALGAACAAAGAAVTATSGGKWHAMQGHVAFPLYRPTRGAALGLNTFGRGCADGRVWAMYGTYHGVQGEGRGFLVREAGPKRCSSRTGSRPLGHYPVDGRRGTLGVHCASRGRCNGFRRGFTFSVTLRAPGGRRTRVFLDSSHLTRRQFLAVVRGLRRVEP